MKQTTVTAMLVQAGRAVRFLPMRQVVVALLVLASAPAAAAEVKIGYLHAPPGEQPLSLVEVPAATNGQDGAELAVGDNNTTGRFLHQSFSMTTAIAREGSDAAAQVGAMADQGVAFIVADLPADALLAAA